MESRKYAKKKSTVSKYDRLGRSTMDKIFGKEIWRFTTIANKADFHVKKSLPMEERKQTFSN